MSVDVNWQSLDSTLGSTIKDLLNEQLNDVLDLPDFLQSVHILDFDLGTKAPEITLKDIADPFEEFYEDIHDEADEDNLGVNVGEDFERPRSNGTTSRRHSVLLEGDTSAHLLDDHLETASVTSGPPPYVEHQSSSGWEGINVPYFHSAFATPNAGIVSASGLATPQPRFMNWGSGMPTPAHQPQPNNATRRRSSVSTQQRLERVQEQARPGSVNDTQLEVHIKYEGNIMITLQANLALNYPSSSFVTLPIEMTISEFDFDAVAVIAYIDKQVHISLLNNNSENPIKAMRISSVIGEQCKMSLTDVDRLEKFMVKEIQDVVEREFVFPSYYTFIL